MRILAMLVATALIVSACNTVAGAGRDISGAGQAIETGAKKVKKAVTE